MTHFYRPPARVGYVRQGRCRECGERQGHAEHFPHALAVT